MIWHLQVKTKASICLPVAFLPYHTFDAFYLVEPSVLDFGQAFIEKCQKDNRFGSHILQRRKNAVNGKIFLQNQETGAQR